MREHAHLIRLRNVAHLLEKLAGKQTASAGRALGFSASGSLARCGKCPRDSICMSQFYSFNAIQSSGPLIRLTAEA
jgi:hypothetical protein